MMKDKYISIKETQAILSMSEFKVRNLIKYKYIKVYIINNNECMLKNEVIDFKNKYDSTITLDEIREYLYETVSLSVIKHFLDKNNINYVMKVGNGFRYSRKEVNDIFNKDILINKAEKIKNKYITFREASKILNLSKRQISTLVQNKFILYFNKCFVEEAYILNIKKEMEESISMEEIFEQIGSNFSLKRISNILKINKIEPVCKMLGYYRYSIKSINSIFKLDKIKGKKLVNLKEACNLIECGYDQVIKFIKEKKLNIILRFNSEILFNREEVLILKDKINNSLSIKDICNLTGYSDIWVRDKCQEIYNCKSKGVKWLIGSDDILYFLDSIKSNIILMYESMVKLIKYDSTIFHEIFNSDKLINIMKRYGTLKLNSKRKKKVERVLSKYFVKIDELSEDILYYNILNISKQFIINYNNVFYIEKEELNKNKMWGEINSKEHYINCTNNEQLLKYIEKLREIKQNYYSINKTKKLLNKTELTILKYIKENKFKIIKKWNENYYICKEEVDEYILKLNKINENKTDKIKKNFKIYTDFIVKDDKRYISSQKACTKLLLKYSAVYSLISNNKLKSIILNKKLYIDEDSMYAYIKNNNLDDFIKNNNYYLNGKQILAKYNLKSNDINKIMLSSQITRVIRYNGIRYIHINELESYLKYMDEFKSRYCSSKKAASILNVSVNTIRRYIRNSIIKNNKCISGKYYVNIEEILELQKERETSKNLVQIFKDNMDLLLESTQKHKSIELMMEYYNYRLTKLNNNYDIKTLNSYAFQTYKYLLINIRTSIFNISLNDVRFITTTNILSNPATKYLIWFLNYVIKKYNDKTKIKKKIIFKNNYNKITEYPYKDNEWAELSSYITNVHIHKNKAINNKKYASIWLYCVFHLSNAWRASDIIRLPNLNLGVIDFDYSKILVRDLNIIEAKALFDDIKNKCINMKISKTSANILLIMPEILLIPTMTAYFICELHRRKEQKDSIFYCFRKGKYGKKNDYDNFFHDSKFNNSFSNRRANKTLLTNTRELFMSSPDDVSESVYIPQTQRAHKCIDSIKSYISNKDANMLDQIVDRGHFGWLYKYLLGIMCDENYKYNTVLEETNNIALLKAILTPKNVESLSKYFLNSIKNNQIVAEKILKCDEKKLTEKILNVYLGKSPSKSEYIDCLNIIPCMNHCKDECFNCPQSLPRIQSIVSISLYIHSVIARIDCISFENVNNRRKLSSIIMKNLQLLNEAVSEFGMDYVNKFIDIKDLKNKLNLINKKLII
ncbi:TPA: helix-turn-helix domain-containing protein [Clostridium botulinum]|uniref:helix-turn-helix domain-containing protein n=1 Tax=Clostridium botulinum TaxID=1491 RepID=UPI00035BAE0B|nr:helix-turn-helix domain-containing protein [Clostridium botulinum]APQ72669.1 DNA binding, excisionase family domain protein [Clostridium botulinum]EPS56243.1 hypothetical protein CLQ_12128 [Clostridium botulinum Af84]MBN3350518.1 DNA-binding protein [Clostridium botulinum]MBN3357554.1 DNA-binding protein [Clostridium botulinum]NFR30460.1 helix-turn-helix domain-containing protein [Clostridium botulinum]